MAEAMSAQEETEKLTALMVAEAKAEQKMSEAKVGSRGAGALPPPGRLSAMAQRPRRPS